MFCYIIIDMFKQHEAGPILYCFLYHIPRSGSNSDSKVAQVASYHVGTFAGKFINNINFWLYME